MKAWILIGASVLATGSAFGFSGREGAAFLDIPVGAGPAAMAGAYTALANDAYAPVYNPGGVARVSGYELAAQHVEYLEDFRYEAVSFAGALGARQGFGVSAQYLTSGKMDRTDVNGYPVGDTFSNYYAALGLAYGFRLGEALSLGITGKWLKGRLDDAQASTYAADLGAYYPVHPRVRLGAAVVNLGKEIQFLDQKDPLPLAYKLGVAIRATRTAWLSLEGVHRKVGLTSGHVGVDWQPFSILQLRLGYRSDTVRELSSVAGFTAGFGLHLWNHEFAYAWLPMGDLGNANYLSLVLRFGQKENNRRILFPKSFPE